MKPVKTIKLIGVFLAVASGVGALRAEEAPSGIIHHSYLVLGSKTAIIDESGAVVWEVAGGSADGFVLPDGNVLVAWGNRVEELTRDKRVVFSYKLSAENKEIGTTERLANGDTLVTEKGEHPRALEVNAQGQVVLQFPLQPETDNAHMQTRMGRQLPNGDFLMPHLLAFAVKEYAPDGKVVRVLRTDLDELGGRAAENWPFSAIRLENGDTVVSLTHGNKVVEFNEAGQVVWKVTNEDVHGLFKDTCGAQRLANGDTVIGSHAASSGISMVEVSPERKIVWTSDNPAAANVHEFQILTTNGKPEPAPPLK